MSYICRNCSKEVILVKIGLCYKCYCNYGIRKKFRNLDDGITTSKPKVVKDKVLVKKEKKPRKERSANWYEPTEEELDAMIAANYPTMPGRLQGEE